jgi:hypothetical protein
MYQFDIFVFISWFRSKQELFDIMSEMDFDFRKERTHPIAHEGESIVNSR